MAAVMELNDLMLPERTATKTNYLSGLDERVFNSHFNRLPFMIRHNLSNHNLFSLPRLVELAQALPAESVEYNSGKIPISQDPSVTPRNGLSIEETIRRIEECQSWMVLKNVERDPEYRALLDACLDEMRPFTESFTSGAIRRDGYIFVTSPNSVTPYHIDNEYNFLLQIRGQKEISQFDRADRSIISEVELEKFYTGGHRNLVFKDEYQAKAKVFQLQPGDGLHFPIAAPHWVKNGPEVSVSFSITFRDAKAERKEMVYRLNAQLRKWGLQPTPPGNSPTRDSLKFNAYRVLRKLGYN